MKAVSNVSRFGKYKVVLVEEQKDELKTMNSIDKKTMIDFYSSLYNSKETKEISGRIFLF